MKKKEKRQGESNVKQCFSISQMCLGLLYQEKCGKAVFNLHLHSMMPDVEPSLFSTPSNYNS